MKTLLLVLALWMTVGIGLGQETTWEQDFDASMARALAKYPQAANPESRFAARMAEVFQEWRETGDRRAKRSSSPELVADLVAAEFRAEKLAKRMRQNEKAAVAATRPLPPLPPSTPRWTPAQKREESVVIPPRSTPSSATVYGADGEIRRVFSNGAGSATIYGPEGVTRISVK